MSIRSNCSRMQSLEDDNKMADNGYLRELMVSKIHLNIPKLISGKPGHKINDEEVMFFNIPLKTTKSMALESNPAVDTIDKVGSKSLQMVFAALRVVVPIHQIFGLTWH